MTPARPPRNPYSAPIVRHRWIFVAGVVFWVLMVAFEIVVVISNLHNHVSFDLTFWVGPIMLFVIATILIRARRLRRSVAAPSQSRY